MGCVAKTCGVSGGVDVEAGRACVCVCILIQMYVHTDVCLYVLVCLDVNAYMFVDV